MLGLFGSNAAVTVWKGLWLTCFTMILITIGFSYVPVSTPRLAHIFRQRPWEGETPRKGRVIPVMLAGIAKKVKRKEVWLRSLRR